MRNVASVFYRSGKWFYSLLIMLLIATTPVVAQIEQKSSGSHKQQRKKFLKQARKSEAAYKDTHLNVNAYTFKIGEAGRRRAKKDERERYQFNDAGEPVKKKRFFARKKRKKN